MNKKIILSLCLVIMLTIGGILVFKSISPKSSLQNPLITLQNQTKKATPLSTFLEYSDPSGFKFSYPDNLSITNNKITDKITYTDLQLSSKEVSGSLSLKIADSKLATLSAWLTENKITQSPKDVMLGNLKAIEVQLADRLILAALDQKILFTIEMPAIEKDFWLPVYNKILENFSFAAPETTASQGTAGSAEDVSFEGEEVVQ